MCRIDDLNLFRLAHVPCFVSVCVCVLVCLWGSVGGPRFHFELTISSHSSRSTTCPDSVVALSSHRIAQEQLIIYMNQIYACCFWVVFLFVLYFIVRFDLCGLLMIFVGLLFSLALTTFRETSHRRSHGQHNNAAHRTQHIIDIPK